MAISSSKLATAILEVNDASFRWYVAGAVLIQLVDWMSKGWLVKLGISLSGLVIFAFVSGVLKLLYHVGDVISWLRIFQNNIRNEGIFVRVLAIIIFWVERILKVLAGHILAGKMLTERLPAIATASFSWLLIVYLAFLTGEEFKKGLTQSYPHVELNILLVLVIFLGVAAIVLNQERKVAVRETSILNVGMGWKEYGFFGILSVGGGLVAYLKMKELGWIGMTVAVLAGVLIFLLSFFCLTDKDETNEHA